MVRKTQASVKNSLKGRYEMKARNMIFSDLSA